MESLPCKGCKGMCCGCGPVPITEDELKKMIIKPYLDVSKNHKYCKHVPITPITEQNNLAGGESHDRFQEHNHNKSRLK